MKLIPQEEALKYIDGLEVMMKVEKDGTIPPSESKKKHDDIPNAIKEAFMNPPENDSVNHPDHYVHGKYETIDVLKDWLTPKEFRGFCLGNAMKYLSRWQNKGGVEDLKKAVWYLNYIIKYMEEEKECQT